jgi:thiamine phosphate synthase YjbQ (UPF0047 family)
MSDGAIFYQPTRTKKRLKEIYVMTDDVSSGVSESKVDGALTETSVAHITDEVIMMAAFIDIL